MRDDLIYKKLNNTLTEAEAREFEELLKDPAYAEEYRLLKMERILWEVEAEQSILAAINEAKQEEASERNLLDGQSESKMDTNPPKKNNWWWVPIVLLVLAAGAYLLFPEGNDKEVEQLSDPIQFAQTLYSKYPPNMSGLKSAGDEIDTIAYIKSLWYEELPQDSALNIIQYLDRKVAASDNEALYTLGHFHMKYQEWQKAEQAFDDFLSQSDINNNKYELTQFYKAVCMIAQGRQSEAMEYMNTWGEEHMMKGKVE